MYSFYKNGTFYSTSTGNYGSYYLTAKYKVSGRNITFTNVMEHHPSETIKYPIAVREYQFGKDHGEDHLKMALLTATYYRSVSDGYTLFGNLTSHM